MGCRVPECKRPHYAKHMCSLHYQRAERGAPLDAPVQEKQKRDPQCTVDDCRRPHKAKGLCDMHLQRWNTYGTTELTRGVLVCEVPGCNHTRTSGSARGWCKTHYRNWWRYGDPLGAEIPVGRHRGDPEREREMTRLIRADLRDALTMRELGRKADVDFLVKRAATHGRKLSRLEQEFADGVRLHGRSAIEKQYEIYRAEAQVLLGRGMSKNKVAQELNISGATLNKILEEQQ